MDSQTLELMRLSRLAAYYECYIAVAELSDPEIVIQAKQAIEFLIKDQEKKES